MEIYLTRETSLGLKGYAQTVQKISDELGEYFKSKNYGEGITSIYIGIICVSPEFESFFKIRKPKYVRGKQTIKTKDYPDIEVDSSLGYDIKLDYEKIKEMNPIEISSLLREKILESLSIVEKMQIKDFNYPEFKNDLTLFFK